MKPTQKIKSTRVNPNTNELELELEMVYPTPEPMPKNMLQRLMEQLDSTALKVMCLKDGDADETTVDGMLALLKLKDVEIMRLRHEVAKLTEHIRQADPPTIRRKPPCPWCQGHPCGC